MTVEYNRFEIALEDGNKAIMLIPVNLIEKDCEKLKRIIQASFDTRWEPKPEEKLI
jgi:hypothetical protein